MWFCFNKLTERIRLKKDLYKDIMGFLIQIAETRNKDCWRFNIVASSLCEHSLVGKFCRNNLVIALVVNCTLHVVITKYIHS